MGLFGGGSGLLGLGKAGGGGLLGGGFNQFAQAGGAASAFLDGDRDAFNNLRRQREQQQHLQGLHEAIDSDYRLSEEERRWAKAYPGAYADRLFRGAGAGAVRPPIAMDALAGRRA